MPNILHGKVIVLTGGGSGLGLEGFKTPAARGTKLSITGIKKGPIIATAKDIEAASGAIIATTVNKFSKLDGVINLASVVGKRFGTANFEDIEDVGWDYILGVYLNGGLNCMRADIKFMNDHGSIINASSIARLDKGVGKGVGTKRD
ncbi:hypothetical protein PVAG01_08367 [Phlyctema vagabunda]|uniref:Uncharacterized protein n=1 Tax=Phlyctema vagabunda TaxID=108571 RepID=A0ABR4P977_9HELO